MFFVNKYIIFIVKSNALALTEIKDSIKLNGILLLFAAKKQKIQWKAGFALKNKFAFETIIRFK